MSEKEEDIVLIDGDLIAFKCASVNETRSIIVKNKLTGEEETWKNRTTWRENNKDSEGFDEDNFEIEDHQDPKHVSYGISVVKTMIDRICRQAGCKQFKILLSGPDNFRDAIPLPKEYELTKGKKTFTRGGRYKGKRTGQIKPLQLGQLRQYMIEAYDTIIHPGEADDLMAEMMYKNGVSYSRGETTQRVIGATIDKDADGTLGWLCNYEREPVQVKFISGLGSLYRDSKGKVRGEGRKFFYFQLLFGDPVDCYRPADLCIGKDFGEVAAYNIINPCATDKECWQAIYDTYKAWYPEPVTYTAWDDTEHTKDAVEIMQMYCDCAHMQRWAGDRVDCRAVMAKLGVDLGGAE
ncbi:hypothetical protein QE327_gp007 [Pseudomonas phage Henu5]|uniref:Uncharacterized protein n=1 Tax=Pseudomonas phage Henu5 TaxID=2499902 RepID=A0A410T7R9_9CAUD|nr:hypothetical protein QE327_gp007 [Pseudomonas phage Henu5]QAU05041.1 hypothetical protein Henu5_gp8 [Pseudomonas phage Henu5]